MKYDAVIFDLFGTLVDNFSFAEHQDVLYKMADTLSANRKGFARLWVDTFNYRSVGSYESIEANIEHVCWLLEVKPSPDKVKEASEIRLDLTRRYLVPRDDAIPTLTALEKAGCNTGLISDCSLEVPILWDGTPFAKLIDVPVFSCMVGIKKPAPGIYEIACEKLNVEPSACLYIGDGSSNELTGARDAGMTPVLLRVPHDDTYDAHRIDAEEWDGESISSLREIIPLVDR